MRTSTLDISADGLSKTRTIDDNADTLIDHRSTDVTVLNADGSRTQTVTELAGNNTMLFRTLATISGNGLSKTIQNDTNGDTLYDEKVTEVTVINANGSVKTTTSEFEGTSNVWLAA